MAAMRVVGWSLHCATHGGTVSRFGRDDELEERKRKTAVPLLVAEGDHGVDFGGSVGGEPGGYQGDEGDDERGCDEGEGVGRAEAEELRFDGSGGE